MIRKIMAHARQTLAAACIGMITAATLTGGPALAEPLRILTSMPPPLTDAFIASFRQRYPTAEVLVLNKNTNSGVDEIVRGNPRGFDIFWASSPEAFVLVGEHQGFAATGCPALPPEGHATFALSSIGWTRRKDSTLFMPGDWDDLLMPAYRGRIGMALPSRSGTSHMTVERLLQVRGWQRGWAYFMSLSENLSTLTSRSFGVLDGVKSDRFDIGLTIDFLAVTEPDLAFRYGRPVMIFPAQIGLLAAGGAPDLACDFIRFVLSDDGQRLLLTPSVGRIPVSAALRAQAGDAVPELMRHAIKLSWQPYNADLAKQRYWSVNAIFDLFISDHLPRRRELWARLRALEATPEAPDMAAETARIERLLTTLPVSEAEAIGHDLNELPGRITDFTVLTDQQKALHDRWTKASHDLLDQADAALSRLEATP
ncbi:ABC transporter substrate-binding protein [Paracoccus tegillarcae]|nr:ABC transporter substrate-binding protein [Paracoccus tegillarcae]